MTDFFVNPFRSNAPVLDSATLDGARKYNQKDYAFYIVANGKIESGWEYQDDAKEHRAENMPESLRAGAKVVKKGGLKAFGIDPDDNSHWLTGAALDSAAESTSSGTPSVGDWIECLADVGSVTCAPFVAEVLATPKPGAYVTSYNEGETYLIPDDAFTSIYTSSATGNRIFRIGRLEAAQGATVFDSVHEDPADEVPDDDDGDYPTPEGQGGLFDNLPDNEPEVLAPDEQ